MLLQKNIKNILKIFFIRKILRVEPGRAFTHMHRFAYVTVSGPYEPQENYKRQRE